MLGIIMSVSKSCNSIDTDGNALLTTIDADTGSIDATLTALSKAEDSVHVSSDQGIMALAVRNDSGAVLAADGDYIPFSMNSGGELRVAGSVGDDERQWLRSDLFLGDAATIRITTEGPVDASHPSHRRGWTRRSPRAGLPALGYIIHRPFWRRGYGLEAAWLCMGFIARKIPTHVAYTLVRPENAPSMALALKLGMKPLRTVQHAGLDHVLLAAHPAVRQQIGDVEQPARNTVDRVLGVAVAKQRAADLHIGELDGENARRVVDC